jgi:hypothetical protein
MQAILNTKNYSNFYYFLNALVVESEKSQDSSVLIWSPGELSDILDSCEKVEVIEHYARKLDVSIVLSAASNSALRTWAKRVGWQVLWEIPGLDTPTYSAIEQYSRPRPQTAGLAS